MCVCVQPLPRLPRCPEVILPGPAFADCLMVVEFVSNFADTLGLGQSHMDVAFSCSVRYIIEVVQILLSGWGCQVGVVDRLGLSGWSC